MSGHNKWSKIKHKKAVTDAQKSKVFSKYARLIALESKKGLDKFWYDLKEFQDQNKTSK